MAPDRSGRKDSARRAAVLTAVSVLLLSITASTQPTPAGPVPLREGLLVDQARGVAYVMTPAGGIAAVDLASGATRWTTSAAAKPLALVGNVLVSQVEPRTVTNRLELVGLNTAVAGTPAVRVRGATELPGVRVAVGETLEGKFAASARGADGNVVVGWSFAPVPRSGMPPDPEATPQAAARAGSKTAGAVTMNLSTGAVKQTGIDAAAPPAAPRGALPAAERIPAAPSAQYESADGRHVLASERVGDDAVWDKYQWTVYDRATRQQIGQMRTHVSFAPFVVRNSILIYETTPYARRGATPEPAKLRGVNLATGQEAWSVPVREVVWRGPIPG